MNIEIGQTEPPPAKQPDLIFDTPAEAEPRSDQLIEKIERLESDLTSSRDGRREERFYWIGTATFLLNMIWAKYLDNNVIFFALAVPQLFILASLAKYLGVDWAVEAIEKSAQWLSENIPWKKRG